jgi:hypothetical protein
MFAFLLMFSMGLSVAFADTIEGRVVSIDAETRHVTLDGGEVMSLTAAVPMEELSIGQLLRLEYELGTVDVSSVLVLEEPPPVSEEPIFVEE